MRARDFVGGLFSDGKRRHALQFYRNHTVVGQHIRSPASFNRACPSAARQYRDDVDASARGGHGAVCSDCPSGHYRHRAGHIQSFFCQQSLSSPAAPLGFSLATRSFGSLAAIIWEPETFWQDRIGRANTGQPQLPLPDSSPISTIIFDSMKGWDFEGNRNEHVRAHLRRGVERSSQN